MTLDDESIYVVPLHVEVDEIDLRYQYGTCTWDLGNCAEMIEVEEIEVEPTPPHEDCDENLSVRHS